MAVKQKTKKKIAEGIVHIKATFNNTLIAITTTAGDLLCQSSAGGSGFKGSRKGTPYAAQLAAETAGKTVVDNFEMRSVTVQVQGPGAGRESAIRALKGAGLEVKKLIDVTKLPHNGCRPPKKRRV